MRIVPSTKRDYAYIEWEHDDELDISKLQGELLVGALKVKFPKGLWIEVSDTDRIPEDVRHSLVDGRFLMLE